VKNQHVLDAATRVTLDAIVPSHHLVEAVVQEVAVIVVVNPAISLATVRPITVVREATEVVEVVVAAAAAEENVTSAEDLDILRATAWLLLVVLVDIMGAAAAAVVDIRAVEAVVLLSAFLVVDSDT